MSKWTLNRLAATNIRTSLEAMGVNVHETTVRRVLHQSGLYGRRARRKPLLKAKHKSARLKFAKDHVNKPTEFWEKVMWSDKTKELFRHNHQNYVWRKKNKEHEEKNTIATVKYGGGSLMF